MESYYTPPKLTTNRTHVLYQHNYPSNVTTAVFTKQCTLYLIY